VAGLISTITRFDGMLGLVLRRMARSDDIYTVVFKLCLNACLVDTCRGFSFVGFSLLVFMRCLFCIAG
jgi:hypothetical protein